MCTVQSTFRLGRGLWVTVLYHSLQELYQLDHQKWFWRQIVWSVTKHWTRGSRWRNLICVNRPCDTETDPPRHLAALLFIIHFVICERNVGFSKNAGVVSIDFGKQSIPQIPCFSRVVQNVNSAVFKGIKNFATIFLSGCIFYCHVFLFPHGKE